MTFLGSTSSGAFNGGLYFVTAAAYHFSPARNLVLGVLLGAVAAVGAWSSGRLARRASPRGLAIGAWLAWALAASLPVVFPAGEGVLWGSALLGGASGAMVFPVVESYVSAGRHGGEMRRALGLFNITWTPAVAVSLLLMPALSRLSGTASLGLAALVNAMAAVLSLKLPSHPPVHVRAEAEAVAGAEDRFLARSSSWLLPLSYALTTLMSPLLPYRLAALGFGGWSSVVAALWMAARFLTFVVMWRSHRWQGRWEVLAGGVLALALGLAGVLLGASAVVVMAALVVFGCGTGLIYYATIYYTLTVGHAAVDAGGRFEALVGVGSALGPLLGLAGHALAPRGGEGVATSLAAAFVAAAAPGALRPYREARRHRRREPAKSTMRTRPG